MPEVNAARDLLSNEVDQDCLHDALTNIGFAWPNNPGVRSSGSDCLDIKEVCFFGRTPESRRSSTQHLLP